MYVLKRLLFPVHPFFGNYYVYVFNDNNNIKDYDYSNDNDYNLEGYNNLDHNDFVCCYFYSDPIPCSREDPCSWMELLERVRRR